MYHTKKIFESKTTEGQQRSLADFSIILVDFRSCNYILFCLFLLSFSYLNCHVSIDCFCGVKILFEKEKVIWIVFFFDRMRKLCFSRMVAGCYPVLNKSFIMAYNQICMKWQQSHWKLENIVIKLLKISSKVLFMIFSIIYCSYLSLCLIMTHKWYL